MSNFLPLSLWHKCPNSASFIFCCCKEFLFPAVYLLVDLAPSHLVVVQFGKWRRAADLILGQKGILEKKKW